jgi:hypothetical protein
MPDVQEDAMNPRRVTLAALALAFLGLACNEVGLFPTLAPTFTPGLAEATQANLALTVYNQGTALVRDRRQFDLISGLNRIAFSDVASQIDPSSVLFLSVTDPEGTRVLEQNYAYDLVGAAALLDKYLDQEIRVVTQDGVAYEGRLLSGRGDIILEGTDGRVTVVRLDNIQEFSFPELPEGLITRPTLLWQVFADQGGRHDVEVTYLTGGLSWQADYVLLLAADDSSIDLDGWVTLTNNSGTTFQDAQLKLIAGDLQRLPQPGYAAEEVMFAAPTAMPADVEQREFFEYHLYEIPRLVTVADREIKQIEFVSATDISAERFFVYDAMQCRNYYWYCSFSGYVQSDPSYGVASNPQVMVMVEFDTEEVEADLPRGRVRVYQEDIDGSALLIGEDTINHTPQGERVRLYVGDAFDIVGERIQADFQRPSSNSLQETYEITLRNHKDEAVEVRVVEHLFRWSEWQILDSNADYTEMDASNIEFRVRLPANGERTVRYTVLYTWP